MPRLGGLLLVRQHELRRPETFVCFANAASGRFEVQHSNPALPLATCTACAVLAHIQLRRQEHRLSTSGWFSTAKGWQVRAQSVNSALHQHHSGLPSEVQVLLVVGASRWRAAPRSQSVGRRAEARHWFAPHQPSKHSPPRPRTAKVNTACAHHRAGVQSLHHPRFASHPTCCLTIRSTGPIAACG